MEQPEHSIESWLRRGPAAYGCVDELPSPPDIPRPPSPVRSEWTDASFATRERSRGQYFFNLETHEEEDYDVDGAPMDL